MMAWGRKTRGGRGKRTDDALHPVGLNRSQINPSLSFRGRRVCVEDGCDRTACYGSHVHLIADAREVWRCPEHHRQAREAVADRRSSERAAPRPPVAQRSGGQLDLL